MVSGNSGPQNRRCDKSLSATVTCVMGRTMSAAAAQPLIAPEVAGTAEVMRTTGWADYALLDSGGGRKLERYGPYTVVRPEP